MPDPGGEQQLRDGDGSSACAGGDDPHIFLLLANHLQGVGQACQRDHGGAVLVVMENGNAAFFLQLSLDLKAAGSRNILQIDAAPAAAHEVYGVYEFVHILRFHAQGNGVHIAEGLEQHALALHDRHTGLRTDVAQA